VIHLEKVTELERSQSIDIPIKSIKLFLLLKPTERKQIIKKSLLLTFDDAPDKLQLRLLKKLKSNDAHRAVFFIKWYVYRKSDEAEMAERNI